MQIFSHPCLAWLFFFCFALLCLALLADANGNHIHTLHFFYFSSASLLFFLRIYSLSRFHLRAILATNAHNFLFYHEKIFARGKKAAERLNISPGLVKSIINIICSILTSLFSIVIFLPLEVHGHVDWFPLYTFFFRRVRKKSKLNEEQKKSFAFQPRGKINSTFTLVLHHSSSSCIHFRCSIFKFHSLPPFLHSHPRAIKHFASGRGKTHFFFSFGVQMIKRGIGKSNCMCSCSMQKAVWGEITEKKKRRTKVAVKALVPLLQIFSFFVINAKSQTEKAF